MRETITITYIPVFSRFSRPQASGYELANQEELNQELLDEDEADDFEVSEPTLRLNSLRSDDVEA